MLPLRDSAVFKYTFVWKKAVTSDCFCAWNRQARVCFGVPSIHNWMLKILSNARKWAKKCCRTYDLSIVNATATYFVSTKKTNYFFFLSFFGSIPPGVAFAGFLDSSTTFCALSRSLLKKPFFSCWVSRPERSPFTSTI